MVDLSDLAQFLDRCFAVERYGSDQGGVYHPSSRPIRRLGLALEPWPGVSRWVAAERIDGLFLHRPWRLPPGLLDIGIIAYHLAFDEHLTTGLNPRLAAALHMAEIATLGEKEGRPLGMIGDVPAQSFAEHCIQLGAIFGGYDEAHPPVLSPIVRVAVVGAMNDALVRAAAARGAQSYVTGQWRQPARNAVTDTGIGVVAVGHCRSEEWGLRALAGMLRERWASLEVVLSPSQDVVFT
jgi:putative NIF3 family GTP cyclohydrolase 1 type 2